jgi:hypothetical protein
MKKTLLFLLIPFFSLAQVNISFETSESYVTGSMIDGQNFWSVYDASATELMDNTLATVANNRAVTGTNSLRFDSDFSSWGYYAGVFSPVYSGYDNLFEVTFDFYPDSNGVSDHVFEIYDYDGVSAQLVAWVRFNWQGNINFYDGTAVNNVSTYTAGSWYNVKIERTATDIVLYVGGTQLASYPHFGTGTSANLIGISFDNFGSGFNIDDLKISLPVASAEDFNSNVFNLYPNPANDVLNINSELEEIKLLSIADLNGRIVKSLEVNQTSSQINVSDLASGTYFVTITSEEGNTVKKFIKK